MAKKPEAQNEVIPRGGKWTRTSVTLPTELMERLGDRLKKVNNDREAPDKLSRDRLFQLMLEWAERELEARETK